MGTKPSRKLSSIRGQETVQSVLLCIACRVPVLLQTSEHHRVRVEIRTSISISITIQPVKRLGVSMLMVTV